MDEIDDVLEMDDDTLPILSGYCMPAHSTSNNMGSSSSLNRNVVSPMSLPTDTTEFCPSLEKAEVRHTHSQSSNDSMPIPTQFVPILDAVLEVALFNIYQKATSLEDFVLAIISFRTNLPIARLRAGTMPQEAARQDEKTTLFHLFHYILQREYPNIADIPSIEEELITLSNSSAMDEFCLNCLRIAIVREFQTRPSCRSSSVVEIDITSYTGHENDVVIFVGQPKPVMKLPKHSLVPICDFGLETDLNLKIAPTSWRIRIESPASLPQK